MMSYYRIKRKSDGRYFYNWDHRSIDKGGSKPLFDKKGQFTTVEKTIFKHLMQLSRRWFFSKNIEDEGKNPYVLFDDKPHCNYYSYDVDPDFSLLSEYIVCTMELRDIESLGKHPLEFIQLLTSQSSETTEEKEKEIGR